MGRSPPRNPRRLPDAPPNVLVEVWGKLVEAEAAAPVPPREVAASIVFVAGQFTPTEWNYGSRHHALGTMVFN